jgi:hypothetical protein
MKSTVKSDIHSSKTIFTTLIGSTYFYETPITISMLLIWMHGRNSIQVED